MDTAKDKKDQVDRTHPVYDKNQPKRDRFTAVCEGTDGLRAGREKYLPMYPGERKFPKNYEARLLMSTSDGILAEGKAGLVGKVFHEDPDTSKVQIDQTILDNIDNQGNNLAVFSRRAFDAAFDGYSVILVDAPKGKGIASLEDERQQGIRPYWRLYRARDVFNWWETTDPITKQTRMSLMVFRECTDEPDGEFGLKKVERFRVYRHPPGGVVTQELWRKTDDEERRAGAQDFIQEMEPLEMPKLTAIPEATIGSLDSEPWLNNEAILEVTAYQKESSYDQTEYYQFPRMVLIGRSEAEKSEPMLHGPAEIIDVPLEGDAKYIQIDYNGLKELKATFESRKNKIAGKLDAVNKDAMAQGRPGDETATEVISDDAKSQARLIVWAQQLEDALNRAIQFTGQFMGKGEDNAGTVELMTAWKVQKAKAEEAKQMKAQADMAMIEKTKAEAASK